MLLKCEREECDKKFYLIKSSMKSTFISTANYGLVEVTYFKCPHCGEVYIAALLNDEIAEINKKRQRLTSDNKILAAKLHSNRINKTVYDYNFEKYEKEDKELKAKYDIISNEIKKEVAENGLI